VNCRTPHLSTADPLAPSRACRKNPSASQRFLAALAGRFIFVDATGSHETSGHTSHELRNANVCFVAIRDLEPVCADLVRPRDARLVGVRSICHSAWRQWRPRRRRAIGSQSMLGRTHLFTPATLLATRQPAVDLTRGPSIVCEASWPRNRVRQLSQSRLLINRLALRQIRPDP